MAAIAFALGAVAGGAATWIVASKFGEAKLLAVQLRNEKEVSALYEEALRQSERVLEFERGQREVVAEIEGRYAKEKEKLSKEAADARALVVLRGGMRDPGKAAASHVSGNSCPEIPPGGGDSGARLSDAAAEFLLGLTERADRDAALAGECLRWARDVKRQQEAFVVSGKKIY